MDKQEEDYQAIDIILAGNNLLQLEAPVAGFVVTFPDNGLDAIMLQDYEATPDRLDKLKAMSKYQNHIFYRPCWLHTQQLVLGEISDRKYWTPR